MRRFMQAVVGGIFLFAFCSITGHTEPPSWEALKEQAFDLYQAKKYDEAIQITQQALDLARKTYGEEDLKVAESMGNLAALYKLKGEESKAEPLFKKARAIRDKHGMTGIPLGIQTEAFFDEVEKRKGEAVRAAGVDAGDGSVTTTAADLLKAPQELRIHGRSFQLEVYAWEDFMPPAHAGGSGLITRVKVKEGQKEATDLRVSRLWAILGKEVWDSGDLAVEHAENPVGPHWPTGSSITIVAEVTRGSQRWRLRSALVEIVRTD